jgi:hypothetical protein
MASDVSIVNSALRKVGSAVIQSLTSGTPEANAANDLYDPHRLKLLRSHHWNFATKRAALARLAAAPAFGFEYKYQTPSDFLRIVSVHPDDQGISNIEYKLESDDIHTDAEEVYLRYVANIVDPNLMSPDFREALSLSLAVDFAISIAQSNVLNQNLRDEYQQVLLHAKSADSIEDWAEEEPAGSWWVSRGR